MEALETMQTADGHDFIGLDGFRLEHDTLRGEAHIQISKYLHEMDGYNSWNVNPKMAATGVVLLDRDYRDQISLVIALVKRLDLQNSKHHYKHRAFLSALLRPLLMRRLPYSEAQLVELLVFVAARKSIDVPLVTLLANVQRYLEGAALTDQIRDALQALKQSQSDFSDKKPSNKIDEILGTISQDQPEAGEAWANHALAELEALPLEKRSAWRTLFAHAITADGGKPTAKWHAEAVRHMEKVGKENSIRHIISWMECVAPPPPFTATMPPYPVGFAHSGDEYRQYRKENEAEIDAYQAAHQLYFGAISEKNIAILKGLTWYVAGSFNAPVALTLGHLVTVAFTSIRERGTWAPKVGNAGIWALGQMPDGIGVGPLAKLRTKLRDRGALKLIAAAIESAAKASGMTVDELEDLAVPTGGLDADGTRFETFVEQGSARLTLDAATGRTKLTWFGADGKPRKTVPAGVKREFGAEVKALKAAEEEVASPLSAQAARFDNALLDVRVLTLGVWRERYGSHPVLGNLARRLLWTVGGAAALPVGDEFVDIAGQTLTGLADDAEVKLWHPISTTPEEVLRWREVLETRGLVQPFKQAHREVYLLTDAERATRTYSNRFAAHILKQHQFNSLCILRGWKNTLRLMVDDSYPPATRLLPQYGLRAEFWIEGIGDDYGTDTNDAGTYLRVATDQVRFYREFAETNYAHAGGGGLRFGSGHRPD